MPPRYQSRFDAVLVALENGIPKTFGLKQMIESYIKFRRKVIRRRTDFDLKKAENILHIVEGLLLAQENLDKIIETIKKSKTSADAKENIIKKFKFSDLQAEAILEITLRQLTSLEREKLQKEEKDLKEINPEAKAKPFVFALGEGMFLKGVDDFLIGKEIGKYKIELSPEKAFGNRESKLVQMIPIRIFKEHKLNPIPGFAFNFDGRMGKVLTVSGGRVMVDFNNPVAGKDVVYNVKVLKKIDNINEKIKAFNDFLFKRDFKFEIEEKKIVIYVEKQMIKFVDIFKEKFKEVLGLTLQVKESEEKKN